MPPPVVTSAEDEPPADRLSGMPAAAQLACSTVLVELPQFRHGSADVCPRKLVWLARYSS
ncbi:hypothetical protein D3C80_2189800 [compost metagenome]